MPRKLDTYEKWVKEGKASAYLSSIRRWVGENATQKQVAEGLHITEKTLIELCQILRESKLNSSLRIS